MVRARRAVRTALGGSACLAAPQGLPTCFTPAWDLRLPQRQSQERASLEFRDPGNGSANHFDVAAVVGQRSAHRTGAAKRGVGPLAVRPTRRRAARPTAKAVDAGQSPLRRWPATTVLHFRTCQHLRPEFFRVLVKSTAQRHAPDFITGTTEDASVTTAGNGAETSGVRRHALQSFDLVLTSETAAQALELLEFGASAGLVA
jgi:hypothetical protein